MKPGIFAGKGMTISGGYSIASLAHTYAYTDQKFHLPFQSYEKIYTGTLGGYTIAPSKVETGIKISFSHSFQIYTF